MTGDAWPVLQQADYYFMKMAPVTRLNRSSPLFNEAEYDRPSSGTTCAVISGLLLMDGAMFS